MKTPPESKSNMCAGEKEPLRKYRKKRKINEEALRSCLKNKTAPVHYLAHVPSLSDGLICRFDRITYMDKSKLENSVNEQKLICVGIIDSPFVENFIQRMNSYLMRLGVRELSGNEVADLLKKTAPRKKAS